MLARPISRAATHVDHGVLVFDGHALLQVAVPTPHVEYQLLPAERRPQQDAQCGVAIEPVEVRGLVAVALLPVVRVL